MSTGKIFVIYLCGPMENVTEKEGRGWRNRIKDAFKDEKPVKIIDPYDLEGTKNTDGSYNDRQIVEGDKFAIMESDLLIVNSNGIGCGTWMELLFSWEQGKLSYGFGDCVNPWYTYHISKEFDSLNNIIKDVKCNLIVH